MSASKIQSSQMRGTPPSHSVVDGFRPLNGDSQRISLMKAGKSTKNITKSESKPQAGPKTNNL